MAPSKDPTTTPLPNRMLFCTLCLRGCPSELAVWFSMPSQQYSPSPEALHPHPHTGQQPKLEGRAICRSCWQLVELLTNFRDESADVATCATCQRKYSRRTGESVHRQLCKAFSVQSAGKKRLYQCSICSVDLLIPTQLEAHLNKHKGIKPYRCRRTCGAFFFGRLARLNHEKQCGR